MSSLLRLLTLVLATATLVLSTAPVTLAKGGKGKPKGSPAPVATHTTIRMVTDTSITIKEAKDTKTFVITRYTEVTLNGVRASVAALKPGMRVSIGAGTDPRVADRIAADDASK